MRHLFPLLLTFLAGCVAPVASPIVVAPAPAPAEEALSAGPLAACLGPAGMLEVEWRARTDHPGIHALAPIVDEEVAVLGNDGQISLWDPQLALQAGPPVFLDAHMPITQTWEGAHALASDASGQLLTVGSLYGDVLLFDMNHVFGIAGFTPTSSPVLRLANQAFGPHLTAIGEDGTLTLWSLGGSPGTPHPTEILPQDARFSQDGAHLWVAGIENTPASAPALEVWQTAPATQRDFLPLNHLGSPHPGAHTALHLRSNTEVLVHTHTGFSLVSLGVDGILSITASGIFGDPITEVALVDAQTLALVTEEGVSVAKLPLGEAGPPLPLPGISAVLPLDSAALLVGTNDGVLMRVVCRSSAG